MALMAMDENKRKRLRELGYVVRGTCSNCKFSTIAAGWGTCSKADYFHNKHGELRALSVNEAGHCHMHEWREDLHIGGFDEFMENADCKHPSAGLTDKGWRCMTCNSLFDPARQPTDIWSVCQGCGKRSGPKSSLEELHEHLVKGGWLVNPPGTMLCSNCKGK